MQAAHGPAWWRQRAARQCAAPHARPGGSPPPAGARRNLRRCTGTRPGRLHSRNHDGPAGRVRRRSSARTRPSHGSMPRWHTAPCDRTGRSLSACRCGHPPGNCGTWSWPTPWTFSCSCPWCPVARTVGAVAVALEQHELVCASGCAVAGAVSIGTGSSAHRNWTRPAAGTRALGTWPQRARRARAAHGRVRGAQAHLSLLLRRWQRRTFGAKARALARHCCSALGVGHRTHTHTQCTGAGCVRAPGAR